GARGDALAIIAALFACVALVDFIRSLATIMCASNRIALCLVAMLVVAVPLLDWSWFSGMETALFAAVLGRALVVAHRAQSIGPLERRAAQWRAGLWGAALLAVRPEGVAIVVPLGVAVAHASGTQRASAALVRAWGPAAVLGAAELVVNRALSGEWAAAGAIRKLLWS